MGSLSEQQKDICNKRKSPITPGGKMIIGYMQYLIPESSIAASVVNVRTPRHKSHTKIHREKDHGLHKDSSSCRLVELFQFRFLQRSSMHLDSSVWGVSSFLGVTTSVSFQLVWLLKVETPSSYSGQFC